MNWVTMGDLMLSVVILAPALVIFSALLFVGLLMTLERSGALATVARGAGLLESGLGATGVNPAPGEIVGALRGSISEAPDASTRTGQDA